MSLHKLFLLLLLSVFVSAGSTYGEEVYDQFVQDPLKYTEKNISQKEFCKMLTELKKEKPKKFKKLCFEKIKGTNETLLIRLGKKMLWQVGTFLVNNAPRDSNGKLTVNFDLKDEDGNTALHFFCALPSCAFGPTHPQNFCSEIEKEGKASGCYPDIYMEKVSEGRDSKFCNDCKKAFTEEEEALEGRMSFWGSLSECAEALIAANASLSIKNNKGIAPIHICAQYGNILFFKEIKWTKELADLQDKNENTPFHLYLYRKLFWAQAGRGIISDMSILKTFKECNADCSIKNKFGKTPIDIAKTLDISLDNFLPTPNVQPSSSFFSQLKTYWKPLTIGTCILACVAFWLKRSRFSFNLPSIFNRSNHQPVAPSTLNKNSKISNNQKIENRSTYYTSQSLSSARNFTVSR